MFFMIHQKSLQGLQYKSFILTADQSQETACFCYDMRKK